MHTSNNVDAATKAQIACGTVNKNASESEFAIRKANAGPSGQSEHQKINVFYDEHYKRNPIVLEEWVRGRGAEAHKSPGMSKKQILFDWAIFCGEAAEEPCVHCLHPD